MNDGEFLGFLIFGAPMILLIPAAFAYAFVYAIMDERSARFVAGFMYFFSLAALWAEYLLRKL